MKRKIVYYRGESGNVIFVDSIRNIEQNRKWILETFASRSDIRDVLIGHRVYTASDIYAGRHGLQEVA